VSSSGGWTNLPKILIKKLPHAFLHTYLFFSIIAGLAGHSYLAFRISAT
jgi:hypothetical protein